MNIIRRSVRIPVVRSLTELMAAPDVGLAFVSTAPDTEPDKAPPGYVSLKELAAYSGLGVRTLRERLRDRVNPLPHRKLGDRVLVQVAEFDRWLDGFRVEGARVPAHLQAAVERVREAAAGRHARKVGT